MKTLKLNYKSTLIIGFAFFGILMLWQVYNNYCPLFLKDLLAPAIPEETERAYIVGIIMACDNIVALFMLPLFGRLSDKTKTRLGKRMPYILIGMLAASATFPFLFISYFYYNSLVGLIGLMGFFLLIMQMYRNPAVSLMPDITPKPLRSKANAIINLIGYLGPIIAGALIMFTKSTADAAPIFYIASACLVVVMIVLFIFIKENKLVAEAEEDIKCGELFEQTEEKISDDKPLSKVDKRNLIILLVSIFLWFMSFNAIETFLSTYCDTVLNAQSLSGTAVIIMTVCSIITFVPAGLLVRKIGRKKSVAIGIAITASGMLVAGLGGNFGILPIFFLGVAFAGIGWAMINVNSYPMVIELCSQNNIGKYTGRYYAASMVAQSLTPILIGFIIAFVLKSYNVLFWYSVILMVMAFTVFIFYKENKEKVIQIKKGIEIFDQD